MTSAAALDALVTALAWLAQASWQAAALGLLVFILSLALRGRLEARWRFSLWLVVVARLALPVTPAAPWSLFRLLPAAFVVPARSSPVVPTGTTSLPTSYSHVATDS